MPADKKSAFCRGRAWIELDHDALRHNVEALRGLLPDGCELMPAVKANAYGHGAVPVARELNRLGVGAFCVASAEEGAELREHGVRGEILILGYTHPKRLPLLGRHDLTQTVIDLPYAKLLNAYGRNIKAHIAVDTGMHRLGEPWENIENIAAMFRLPNLRIEGICTHLCADETKSPEDKAFTLAQGQAFRRVLSQLEARGCVCPRAHLLASYGLLNYPCLGGDYARVGIALYGVLSTRSDSEHCALALRPVLSVRARVAAVKALRKGESAGYGLQFVAEEDSRIAVLAIGYADGLPRALSCGVGTVLLRGRRAPIVGRICMDQTLVDVSAIPDVRAGDAAVIIGRSDDAEITACDLAEQAGTISNEILSRLGERLERQMI
jgi:serine/alanine racemase